MRKLVWLVAAAGCTDPEPPALLETGWFTTEFDGDPSTCADHFADAVPVDGMSSWYWRDRPTFWTATPNQAAYSAWIETASGARLPTELSWDESGVKFTLEWDGWLDANTTYTLGSLDCGGLHETAFTTSDLGAPLQFAGASALVNRTYLLDFVGADWVEPAQLGSLLALFFNRPILLGVTYADDRFIDLLGAQGDVDNDGVVSQDLDQPAWDFALADFTGAPFVDGYSPEVTFVYADGNTLIDVPISEMSLQGTFSPDGTVFGGGVLAGLGDTRNLGSTINQPGNDGAMCELAGGLGVECTACLDGEPYCLQMRAEHMVGTLLPDVALVDNG